jgi:hypothetical protein
MILTKLNAGVGRACDTFINELGGNADLLGYHTDVC